MLSDRIKDIRIKAGLSQAQLAKKAELPQTSISYWERGCSIPDVLQADRIAKACGVAIEALIDGEQDGTPCAP